MADARHCLKECPYYTMLMQHMEEAFLLLERPFPGAPPDAFVIRSANRQFCRLTSKSPTELEGLTLAASGIGLESVWMLQCQQALASGIVQTFEIAGSNQRFFAVKMYPVGSENVAVLISDITDTRQNQDRLERYRMLFDEAQDVVIFTRRDGRIIEVNQKALSTYGYSREKLLSMRTLELRHPDTQNEYHQQMLHSLREGILFETTHVTCDGRKIPVEVSTHSAETSEGHFRIFIIRDITERKAYEAKIRQMATVDSLTGVWSRAYWLERLEETVALSLRSGDPLTVMIFDVDRFKRINDVYGHSTGDSVLRIICQQVSRCLRDTDYLGRLGGDEFVILAPLMHTAEDLQSFVERIQAEIGNPEVWPLPLKPPTLSIGVATCPAHGQNSNELLKKADEAMYRVKRSGGNGWQFI